MMKGGREGLKNHLDVEINSVFSFSRRKMNFFFNVEMYEQMNDVHKTLGKMPFFFLNPFI